MATPISQLKATAAELATRVVGAGLLVWNETAKRWHGGDGVTMGGIAMARHDERNDGALGYATAVKTDDYTITTADGGMIIVADKAEPIEFSLTSAALLGDGFSVLIKNDGAGVLTITPDGAEEIDGESSLVLPRGASIIMACDGVSFRTLAGMVGAAAGIAYDNGVSGLAGDNVQDALDEEVEARLQVAATLFRKDDVNSVAFTKTGSDTVSIKAGTLVEVGGTVRAFNSDTPVTMPTLTAGTDYAIWIKSDGSLEATDNHTSPPIAGSRKLGGFHYAPGGNATGYNAGGDTTPAINEYSLWDLKFRPACPDPRGMVLVAGRFWVDIYLLGVNHHTDGTSKYNVTIADGSSPPKVPAAFGGNGSTTYANLTWFVAAEVMESHGKTLLSYSEFAAAAYGTKEAQSGGTDPVSTILRQNYTSKWGVMLATGILWVWGRDFGGSYGAASYVDQGRGSAYMLSNAALFGGVWDNAADSGSRASYWNSLPSNSDALIGARGRCDHLVLV